MLQQVLERKKVVLCVLTQKIVTAQPCVISEHTQLEEKCSSMVGIPSKTVQVCSWVRGADAASLVPVLPAGAVASLAGVFMCQDSSIVS